mgnify:CR=1 FL=1
MSGQSRSRRACSLAFPLALVLLWVLHSEAVLLPIVPLPISFNYGGSSPMSMGVACSWGTYVEVDGQKQVRQGCGSPRYSWKIVQESGDGAGSEIPLGAQAQQQRLTLTLAPTRGQGACTKASAAQ